MWFFILLNSAFCNQWHQMCFINTRVSAGIVLFDFSIGLFSIFDFFPSTAALDFGSFPGGQCCQVARRRQVFKCDVDYRGGRRHRHRHELHELTRIGRGLWREFHEICEFTGATPLPSPLPHFMAARGRTAHWIGAVFFHRAKRGATRQKRCHSMRELKDVSQP